MSEADKFIDQCKVLHDGLFRRMETIADEAADKAVKQTLLAVGIDVTEPIRAQRDFAIMREVGDLAASADFRKDLEHLRTWRTRMDTIGSKSLWLVLSAALIGIIAATKAGFVGWFTPPTH